MSALPAVAPRIRRLGDYVLGRRIGAGGMAAVFAARQKGPLDLGRLVAVKVMSTALVGDASYERLFLREAGIATRLEHPYVVRVYEVGEADGTLFIAMEFVHGASLRALCNAVNGPLPLAIALRLLADTADALHAAHELCDAEGKPLSLVHQDVSPHNIMVTYDGVTKLLDFGVARIGAMDASRTETIRGKPAYLAQEQINSKRIDRRTDVFQLGIVAFELLTGEKLFAGETALEVYSAIGAGKIRQLASVAPNIPRAIADVCQRALSHEPDDRYPSAEAFAQALDEARSSAGIGSPSTRELANWIYKASPPRYSTTELEQEIVRGGAVPQREDGIDVADMPTQQSDDPLPREPGTRSEVRTKITVSPPPSHRFARAAAVLTLLVGGIVAWLLISPLAEQVPRNDETTPVQTASAPTAQLAPSTTAPPLEPRAQPSATSPPPSATSSAPPSALSSPPPEPPTQPSATSPPPNDTSSALPSALAAPPPPPTPPTAIVTTRLGVTSSPWGAVLIDGVSVGNSPKMVDVTPGVHSVTVTTAKGAQQTKSVTVKEGETRVVSFGF